MSEEKNNESENDVGSISVSEEVVAIIAGAAAAEVPGVYGMSGGIAGDIAEILGRKNLAKGVKVKLIEKEATIDLYIVVEFGHRIPNMAWDIQEKVKGAVESMSGLNVIEVNIHVQGVNFDKEKEKSSSLEKN